MSACPRNAADGLRGVMRLHEPMARHTVWGLGGPAERFYQPADVRDLAGFLATLPIDEPVLWLGLGSNLLVRDGGLHGTVIATSKVLLGLEQSGAHTVRAEAGVACPKVAKFCAERGLGGCEFLAGIPGTVGGALAMNAGAFGGETWDAVRCVECIDRRGVRRRRAACEYATAYRSVRGPGEEWFLAAELVLRRSAPEVSSSRMRELVGQRGATQPMGIRSCGSVFKNPPGDYAARLIDVSGLKGARIGDAMVSDKHANFILNMGAARAADVEALMALITATVEREHGVCLEPEVRIVGHAGKESRR